MMYYVNWVLTSAQLELIAADVSVVDYNHGKGKNERKKGEFDDTPADERQVQEAGEKWIEKYGSGENAGAGLSIGDIIGGGFKADVGVRIEE